MEELILKEKEIRIKLKEILEASGLPAFILKSVIKDFFEQLSNVEQQEYNQALQIKAEKEKKEVDKK